MHRILFGVCVRILVLFYKATHRDGGGAESGGFFNTDFDSLSFYICMILLVARLRCVTLCFDS